MAENLFGPALGDCPLIISTDIGASPDAAVALVLAAITQPNLTLVVTADELPDGRRSKFARHLLDLLGRDDVRVVAGHVLGESAAWVAEGLSPAEAHSWPLDLYEMVTLVCGGTTPAPVRWLGLGPMTDLAHLLAADVTHPYPLGLVRRLWVTQLGGALDQAELNFQLDPAAVHAVLSRVEHLALVMPDHTFSTAIAVGPDSPIYRMLSTSRKPWAQPLIAHLDQWFDRFRSTNVLHDPAALSAAMNLPFVALEHHEVRLDTDARMSLGTGFTARLSAKVDYPRLLNWVHLTLRDGTPVPTSDSNQDIDHRIALAAEQRKPAQP